MPRPTIALDGPSPSRARRVAAIARRGAAVAACGAAVARRGAVIAARGAAVARRGALIVACVAACGAARPRPTLSAPEVSPALPALVYPIEGGGELALGEHRGRVVVLDVWATYCKPCRKSFPLLDRLALERPDVLVVGLSLDEEDPPVAAFLREVPAAFVIARDRTLSISTGALQVTKLPTLFLIDRAGRVRLRLDEPDERDYAALPALVDLLRAEPAPTAP